MHIKRAFAFPDQSFFLFGPRGTGKSTIIGKRVPEGHLINLLIAETKRNYLTNPDRLLEVVRALSDNSTIVIDEIQRVPELLSVVHALMEENKSHRFILTGSSSRKLKRDGVDLLGGRALKKSLHPFMACELGNEFNLTEALKLGLIPLRFSSANPSETLDSYISLYLEEEVKAEGLVRNIEPFSRFLEALSFSHGSLVNMSNIARECSVSRNTCENWLEITQDLLITFTIPVFNKRAKRTLSKQKKFYFFDAGVYYSLRKQAYLDIESEILGSALEGLVAQHLRAWVEYSTQKHSLYFWRTKAGLEVDFVVYGESGLWAIEVKNSAGLKPQDIRGLKHFKEDYPEAQTLLLYRGQEKIQRDGILCLPCEAFLRQLLPNQSIMGPEIGKS